MDHMFPKNGSKIFFAGGLDMPSRKSLVGQITRPRTHKPSDVMRRTREAGVCDGIVRERA
jgi:hypothetical protein